MRTLILLGAAAMALMACNGEQSAQERPAAERNVTREVVATNDTTAIDAATGEAANMAADVEFLPELNNADGNAAAPSAGRPRATTGRRSERATAAEPRASEPRDDEAPELNTL